MKKVLVAILFVAIACGKEKKEKLIVVPPNPLFIINDTPSPIAFKTDTVQPWVIMDSTATLKALLKMLEDNYKNAVARQKKIADTTKLK